jgi:hypothetical protein
MQRSAAAPIKCSAKAARQAIGPRLLEHRRVGERLLVRGVEATSASEYNKCNKHG